MAVTASIFVLLASTGLPIAALAQQAPPSTPVERDPPLAAPPFPTVQNQVELHLKMHYNETNPFLEMSHGTFQYPNGLGTFSFDGQYTFEPNDQVGVPFPLSLNLDFQTGRTRVSNISTLTQNTTSSTTSTTTTTTGGSWAIHVQPSAARTVSHPLKAAEFLGFGGGGGSGSSASSSGPLWGPEIDYALPEGLTSWVAFDLSAQIYARVLFGTLTLEDQSSSIQDYSLGLRLYVPVWRPTDFSTGPYMTLGPSWLQTHFGHALGFDLGVGWSATLRIANSVYFSAQFGVDTFNGSDIFRWGWTGSIGFNVGF